MAWIVFEVGVNIAQSMMMVYFVKNRLTITKPHLLADFVCMAMYASFLSSYLFTTVSIPDTLGFLIPLVYALYVSDDAWYISVYWIAVLAILFLLTINLSIHIFMTLPAFPYSLLMKDGMERLLFVVVTNLLLLSVVYCVSKLKRDYAKPAWPVYFLFMLMNLAILLIEESVYRLQMEQEPHLAYSHIYVGLCLCMFLSIFLYHMMMQSATRENQYRAEIDSMALLAQHQEELERVYQNLRSSHHDFKHHVQTLGEMVRSGKKQDAAEYLNEYQKAAATMVSFQTGCTAVDALLTAKFLTLQKQNITLKYTAYPLSSLPIATTDFCSIVGNLLDNAIEGVQRIAGFNIPPQIQLTFSRTWNIFYIFCVNPCNPATIKKEKNRWLSSKDYRKDTGLHAIGIRNIEKIVKAVEGHCSFQVDDATFSAKVALPYPFQEEEGEVK